MIVKPNFVYGQIVDSYVDKVWTAGIKVSGDWS